MFEVLLYAYMCFVMAVGWHRVDRVKFCATKVIFCCDLHKNEMKNKNEYKHKAKIECLYSVSAETSYNTNTKSTWVKRFSIYYAVYYTFC